MGHTVLAVPVPELDEFIRERTAFYDASFVSADPEFVHAHITLLAPCVAAPTAADLHTVGSVVAGLPAFEFRLERLKVTSAGYICLFPDPEQPFLQLMSLVRQAFPGHEPYQGLLPPIGPHLTLDRASSTVSLSSVRRALGLRVPVDCRAERVDLQWWANHDCRRLHTWELGAE